MKSYLEIKSELVNLTRQEQYKILLCTDEWQKFRNKILELDSHQCQNCQLKEGVIEEKIPEAIYLEKLEKVFKHNDEFNKNSKNPVFNQRQMKILLGEIDGTFEGLLPMPSDTIVIGQAILQIHHKLYYLNKLPWEYNRKDVITLCSSCHKAEHSNKIIYVFNDQTKIRKTQMTCCSKCCGTGYIAEYDYFLNGICFSCGGQGMLNN